MAVLSGFILKGAIHRIITDNAINGQNITLCERVRASGYADMIIKGHEKRPRDNGGTLKRG